MFTGLQMVLAAAGRTMVKRISLKIVLGELEI
jgi:hypothetical protein